MPDDEAFMALVLSNTHGELTPIERGMHALKSGMSVRGYAEKVGRASGSVQVEMQAAKVAGCMDIHTDMSHHALSVIHSASEWLWPALVQNAAAHDLTVDAVRKAVARVKDAPTPVDWIDRATLAIAIVSGEREPSEVTRLADAYAKTEATIRKAEFSQSRARRD